MQDALLQKFKKVTTSVDKWFTKANAYMYNFRDGHFQFPYVPNDPELMIEGIKKTPFVTFDEPMQCLETNSAIMKIKLKFLNIEEGLWMTATHSHWKVQTKVVALPVETPSDYYFLTYSRSTDAINVKIEGHIQTFDNDSRSWTLYKSTTALDAFFTKNCKAFTTLFIFNKTWIEKNISNITEFNQDIINQMLDANTAYKHYIYDNAHINNEFNDLYSKLNDVAVNQINMAEIKQQVYGLILGFFKKTNQNPPLIDKNIETISSRERIKIERIEKMLNQTLTNGFCGLEAISKDFDISQTKLKKHFKIVFDDSVYSYYQKKQMELSVEFLKQQIPIQKIAEMLCYENAGKFSSKFKDVFGVLPSKYF